MNVFFSGVRTFSCYYAEAGEPVVHDELNSELLEPLIFAIRGHRVVLDTDLARVYGVSTKTFNQAFKRNQYRFPADFAFQLTAAEFADLRSQFAILSTQPFDLSASNWSQTVTSSDQGANSARANSSQFARSSSRHRGTTYRPWAFTEHGALMAANILRSKRAIEMSIFVVRAFVRLREHIVALRDVYQKLLPLLQPPPDLPKRRIGFHTDED